MAGIEDSDITQKCARTCELKYWLRQLSLYAGEPEVGQFDWIDERVPEDYGDIADSVRRLIQISAVRHSSLSPEVSDEAASPRAYQRCQRGHIDGARIGLMCSEDVWKLRHRLAVVDDRACADALRSSIVCEGMYLTRKEIRRPFDSLIAELTAASASVEIGAVAPIEDVGHERVDLLLELYDWGIIQPQERLAKVMHDDGGSEVQDLQTVVVREHLFRPSRWAWRWTHPRIATHWPRLRTMTQEACRVMPAPTGDAGIDFTKKDEECTCRDS